MCACVRVCVCAHVCVLACMHECVCMCACMSEHHQEQSQVSEGKKPHLKPHPTHSLRATTHLCLSSASMNDAHHWGNSDLKLTRGTMCGLVWLT